MPLREGAWDGLRLRVAGVAVEVRVRAVGEPGRSLDDSQRIVRGKREEKKRSEVEVDVLGETRQGCARGRWFRSITRAGG